MARLGRVKGQEGEKARLGMGALMRIQVSRLERLLMLVSRAKPQQSKSGRRRSIPKMLLQGDVLACCQGVVVVL